MRLIFIQHPDRAMNKEYFIKLTSKLYRLTLFFPTDEPMKVKIRKLGADILANLIFILEGAFYQSRELIDDTEKNIEALNSFFGVIKTLDWVDNSDILEIQKEYGKIREELKKISEIQSLKISEIHALQLETEKRQLYQQKTLLGIEPEQKQETAEAKEDEGIELSQLEPKPLKKEVSFAKKTENNQNIESGQPVEKSYSKESLLDRQKKILEILKEKGRAQVGDFKKIFPEVSKRTLRRDFRSLVSQKLVERIGEKNNTFYEVSNGTVD